MKYRPLVRKRLLQSLFSRSHQAAQHCRHGYPGLGGQFTGHVDGALCEFGIGPHLGDQAQAQRFGSRYGLGPQDHVDRPVAADEADKSRTAAPGRNAAQVKLGQADFRAFQGSEPEVTGQWQLQSPAEAVTEKCCDPRFAHVLDGRQDPQTLVEDLVDPSSITEYGHEFLEIHTHREVLLPRPGDDDGTDSVVGGDLAHQCLQCIHERERHAVVRRVVDRHDRDGVPAFEVNGISAHLTSPFRSAAVQSPTNPFQFVM